MEHWRDWKPLADLTPAELRALAAEYREMAATAREALPVRALGALADRYDAMAERREREGSFET